MQTRAILLTILHDLPHGYGAMAGTISSVAEVRSNEYEVRILHEERTDVLTFEASVTPDCRVTISRIGERVSDSRTWPGITGQQP